MAPNLRFTTSHAYHCDSSHSDVTKAPLSPTPVDRQVARLGYRSSAEFLLFYGSFQTCGLSSELM